MTSETQTREAPSGLFIKLFIPYALAFFMSALLRTINSVLSPVFIETFQMSASDLGVMTSAYFLSFAAAQIPVGVSLDRYGPSKTLSSFLIFGVIGCIVFAMAPSTIFLFIGRALVGLGVSGCLMAAYKAYGDWLPANKLPIYNSMQSFVGGIGGMVATTPINFALDFMSWRMVFLILGGLTAIIAIMVYFAPSHPDERNVTEPMSEQFKGMLSLSVSKKFWRLAPLAIMGQATYLALNSLWIGPWYSDVMGMPDAEVPNLLFICAAGIALGYLANGFVASKLKDSFKISVFQTTVISMAIYTVLLFGVVFFPQYGNILWPLFVFFGPFSLLTYPVFSSMYEPALSGRVQSTYNMYVFIMSTVIQSGMGFIIDLFEPISETTYNPQGYHVSILILAGILTFTILWAIFYRRDKNEIQY